MPRPNRSLRRLPLLLWIALLPSCDNKPASDPTAPPPEPPPPVSFTHQIRPLLARECFGCHGRHPAQNRSGLRLDAPEFAFDPLDTDLANDRHAFVPGDRERSAAWHVAQAAGPAPEISQHHRALSITDDESALLGRWIDEGARYEPHWAFQPLPATVPVPESSGGWANNEIDRFIHARLAAANLAPSPPADSRTLFRRLALALTGLPPASDELSGFETADVTSIVSRLLDSPAFGEHLAALWLDAARYADPAGPHTEHPGTRWVYRDWVIAAFNRNLPFDKFLAAQLAGDLSGRDDDIVATAFNRLHPLSDELAADPAEAIAANAAARVRNLGSTILGLRLHCAQCHDHPHDPIATREFYALTAFFNSIPEHGIHQHDRIVPGPTHPLPTAEQLEALFEAQSKVEALEQQLATTIADSESEFQSWLEEPSRTPFVNDCVGIFDFDSRQSKIRNLVVSAAGALDVSGHGFTAGLSGHAVQCDGDAGISLAGLLPISQTDPWTITLRIRTNERKAEPRLLFGRACGPLGAPRGIELILEGGRLQARIVREQPANALAIRTTEPVVSPGHWTLVTWIYDGSSSSSGMRLFVDGREAAAEVLAEALWKSAALPEDEPLEPLLGGRPGAAGFSGGAIDDLQLHARALTALEAATLYDGRSLGHALAHPAGHLPALRQFYFSSLHEPAREIRRELAQARAAHTALESAVLEVSVMRELPEPRPTHVLAEGRFDSPRTDATLVAREIPRALLTPEFEDKRFASRQDLAVWIASPDHPLTARVIVNRIWKHFFGAGLVATENDFGIHGAAPTHPGLLDWLARDFVDHGWDLKRLCRQIVLSATFQQDASPRPATETGDPQNRLLSRGPSVPLTAPQCRDLVLHAAGLLDTNSRPSDGTSTDEAMFRSLYLPRHHPVPPPLLTDASGRCGVDHTAEPPTPDPPSLSERELLLASRSLASLVLRGPGSNEDRLHALSLRLAGRPMNAEEMTEARAWLDALSRSENSNHDNSPVPLQPAADRNAGPDPAAHAQWSEVIRNILESRQLVN